MKACATKPFGFTLFELVIVLGALAFFGAIVWVLIHFIAKFW